MEKRRQLRIERRLVCRVTADSLHGPGIVRDVSETGLFIETSVNPSLNSIVKLLFSETRDQPEFSFEAGVARTREPPSEDQFFGRTGIGLEVIPPMDAFERWIIRPARPMVPATSLALAPLGSEARSGLGRYRVRLVRQDRPGTQIVTLRCESEAAARSKALDRLSGVWRIAESQPV